MRKIVIASILALALAGCAGQSAVTGGTGAVTTPATPSNIVAQVQAATTTACKFLPTAETVLNIIGTFTNVSAVSAITPIADSICGAVASQGTTLGRHAAPRVRGVVVKGRFVR